MTSVLCNRGSKADIPNHLPPAETQQGVTAWLLWLLVKAVIYRLPLRIAEKAVSYRTENDGTLKIIFIGWLANHRGIPPLFKHPNSATDITVFSIAIEYDH